MLKRKPTTEPYDTDPGETDTMPVVPYRILYADLPFYSDSSCTDPVAGAKIAILEGLDPDDEVQELDVVPSRKAYQPGQLVSWVLNHKQIWEECWYRNPETGQAERAWAMHAEFTGQVISRKAQEADRSRLEDLEKRMQARKEKAGSGTLLN